MKIILYILSLSIFLTGCVSSLLTRSYTPSDSPPTKTIHIPAVDIVADAEVGQLPVRKPWLQHIELMKIM